MVWSSVCFTRVWFIRSLLFVCRRSLCWVSIVGKLCAFGTFGFVTYLARVSDVRVRGFEGIVLFLSVSWGSYLRVVEVRT